MSIKVGDTVKITTDPDIQHSQYEGKTGTVVHAFADGKTFKVELTWTADEGSSFDSFGALASFYESELEVVKGVDEDEQIRNLARVLYNEPGNEDWDMEQSHKSAAYLYKAGVRFSG